MFTVNPQDQLDWNKGEIFQNISCLRLMVRMFGASHFRKGFQNISCLRLIIRAENSSGGTIIFQNISCLRLIHTAISTAFPFKISKHFMFTVN